MVQRLAVRGTLNHYFIYESVTEMQNQLGWRSIEQNRYDARVIMLYKILHRLVATHTLNRLHSYFEQCARMIRNSHPLRQIYTTANYNNYYKCITPVIYSINSTLDVTSSNIPRPKPRDYDKNVTTEAILPVPVMWVKYSFFPATVVYWNSIPSPVVTMPILN